ncbi:MAG: DUF2249 domain-containing protein [Magnetococcales bacterium]|nr:DUF2249 domain-containing protein [Magnetococcales bacterium]
MDNQTTNTPDLDVRALPHPEPLKRILEETTRLAPGGTLTVLHNRIPYLLYPRLAERGLLVDTEEKPENRVILTIRRPAGDGRKSETGPASDTVKEHTP